MELTEVLSKENISFNVDINSREEVFDYLIDRLYDTGIILDKKEFKEAVLYRETLSETGLGGNIAIPHGKSAVVTKPGISFVRLQQEVLWPSLEGETAQYIFLLAIPENNENNEHIKLISQLTRSLIKEEVITAIKNVNSPEALLEIL